MNMRGGRARPQVAAQAAESELAPRRPQGGPDAEKGRRRRRAEDAERLRDHRPRSPRARPSRTTPRVAEHRRILQAHVDEAVAAR